MSNISGFSPGVSLTKTTSLHKRCSDRNGPVKGGITSYTPILLTYLEPPKGAAFTAVMWIIAAAGIVMKLCWFHAPRWLTTSLYLLMGWAILADVSIFSHMSIGALWLLVLGGVCYTIGGVIYGLKKPNLSVKIGFHELFHLFVLGGSLFHYLLVLFYIA